MSPGRGRLLALVLAGGEGGRLGALTEERAKPAVPFAGVYRLIDFPLSNCRHSGISDVWVLQQYEPRRLTEHLAGGRPWDLDRTYGGFRVVHPYLGDEEAGWYRGNADALYRNLEALGEFGPELVLVLSADHVYKLDYRDVAETHRATGAEVTVVTTEVPPADAGRFGLVQVDGDGRITAFEYKPDEPRGTLATAEIFLYDAEALRGVLEEIAAGREPDDSHGDFGDELLPRFVERGRAYAHRLDGYWRDVGTVPSYWGAHMELLSADAPLRLDDRAWPILSSAPQRPPALVRETAEVHDSLVSPGCVIAGRVERSVLSPGVVVEAGASVENAVLHHDVVVRRGARVTTAIVDGGVEVEPGAAIEGSPDDVAIVGERERVTAVARPASE